MPTARLTAIASILDRGNIDDAFITFRYAENLAHGHGLAFNPGERVEGTSTFLTTVVLALGVVMDRSALGLEAPRRRAHLHHGGKSQACATNFAN